MSLAQSNGHFPIRDLLASHLEAQNWRDVPQTVEYEEPNLSIDVRSKNPAVPTPDGLNFPAALNFNNSFDFNRPLDFNTAPDWDALDSNNAFDFNEPLGFNEQMLLDDGTFQNQPLVSGYKDGLSNDNGIPSFEDLWPPATDF